MGRSWLYGGKSQQGIITVIIDLAKTILVVIHQYLYLLLHILLSMFQIIQPANDVCKW